MSVQSNNSQPCRRLLTATCGTTGTTTTCGTTITLIIAALLTAGALIIAVGSLAIARNRCVSHDGTATMPSAHVINAAPFDGKAARFSPREPLRQRGQKNNENVGNLDGNVVSNEHNSASQKVAGGSNGFSDKINTDKINNERDEFGAIKTTTSNGTASAASATSSLASEALTGGSELPPTPPPMPSYRQQLLPHRHKRYLVFPESSSFQLIFDLIIGIVDYTSFAILGVTCAVAWELPSKPPSEILDDLKLRLNDGTFGSSRRNDSTQQRLEYVDATKQHEGRAPHEGYVNATSSRVSGEQVTYWSRKDDAWRGNRYPQRPQNALEAQRWMPAARDRPPTDYWHQQWAPPTNSDFRRGARRTSRTRQLLQAPPTHRVYPVFGRRRRRRRRRRQTTFGDFELKLRRVHRREHLRTRQKLFAKIEKLFGARGYNGTECVLRAVCETAERNRAGDGPRSFITELLRAVFSLPPDVANNEAAAREVAAHYRDAHARARDCARRYALCDHSIWSDAKYGINL